MTDVHLVDPLTRALHKCEAQTAEIRRLKRHMALLAEQCRYKGGFLPMTFKPFVVKADQHSDSGQWRFSVESKPTLYYTSEYSFTTEHDAIVGAYNLIDYARLSTMAPGAPGTWELV